jgi:hypothetical protein
MAWERRGGKQYYYRSVRQGNSVWKQYLGMGEKGRLAAEADQAAPGSSATRQGASCGTEPPRH